LIKVGKGLQAAAVIICVLALALVYVGHRTATLEGRVSELENLIVGCEITIDNGLGAVTENVYLTKGTTALEALRRVAVVETTYYAGLGEFIDSINGVANDEEAGKYWMWYLWENGAWKLASVGPGSYKIKDGDKIKFSYEVPAW